MTIGFPNDRVWQAANWVVRAFCDHARPHLADFPLLAERIEDNFLTELWSFDVGDDPAELDEMRRLVARVVADNQKTGGADFHDPSAIPAYLDKLGELAALVERSDATRGPPVGPRTVADGRVIVDQALYLAAGQGVFRGHLADDPQQTRLVTQARLHDISPAGFARRWALEVEGIARLEYAGPLDHPDRIGWNGHCIVEVEPRGQPALALARIGEPAAIALAVEVLAVVARAHAAGLVVGGIRPELIYAWRDADGRPRLAGLAPRGPMFLARSHPLSSGDPPFIGLYTPPLDPPLEPPGDVYAVALTFVHLIQGAHPFGEHHLHQVPRMAAGEAPGWRGSPALGALLSSALQPDPAQRPTAAELAARLRGL